jgi:hypothetical protein
MVFSLPERANVESERSISGTDAESNRYPRYPPIDFALLVKSDAFTRSGLPLWSNCSLVQCSKYSHSIARSAEGDNAGA